MRRKSRIAGRLACLLAALLVVDCFASVRLPSLIGDGMVLQRDCVLTIWGYANKGEKVQVSFRNAVSKVIADEAGRWNLTLPPQAAGGPDSMTVKASNTIVIRNILVGDVWIASGQSNMEFALKEVDDAAHAIAGADDSQIRLFRVPHRTTAKPQNDLGPAQWQVSSPGVSADFSAVGYLFAEQLRKRHKVPIGLIQATWSGTYAESWVSPETLRAFPEFADRLGELERVTPAQEAAYEQYVQVKARWSAEHRLEDRGMVSGVASWAQPSLDTKDWPQIELPRPDSAWGTDFKGFDGTVWYRREVVLPPSFDGQDIELHLGAPFNEEEA